MKNLIAAVLVFVSFNAFGQYKHLSEFAEGMWRCNNCLSILNIRHDINNEPIVEVFTGHNGKLRQATILENSYDKLVVELYTPQTNWRVKMVFYFEEDAHAYGQYNTLLIDTTGSTTLYREVHKRI